ncbi:MAG TPA: hypothetical protein VJ900_00065 [Patescibacteria group bacterium]|nr:hypothetical protein [Patescibacteria group bacterium]
MKKIKQILIFFIILITFLFFISLTLLYSNNNEKFIPENTLVYINIPNKGLENLANLKPFKKISLLDSNFKAIENINYSDVENLGFIIIKKNENIDLALVLNFKQKDKFKNLVDLNKDSILKLDSKVLGIRTNKDIFNNIKKDDFKSNFFQTLWSKVKLLANKSVGDIYFNFNQFQSRDNYFNNLSTLKSSVLSLDKKKAEIGFSFKSEFYLNYKGIKDQKFTKPFVFGYKENRSIEKILDNLKKNFALEYPIIKKNILPDNSTFLEKIADPENFIFKETKLSLDQDFNKDAYVLNNKNVNIIVLKRGDMFIMSNQNNALKNYLIKQDYLKQEKDLFFYLPDLNNGFDSLFLKQNNNKINGYIKLKND